VAVHENDTRRLCYCSREFSSMTLVPSAVRRNRADTGSTETVPDRSRGRPSIASSSNRGLLRVEEAAEWLGLGRTKAYELVYKGVLPSVTIGRSRRVPVSALEAFVRDLIENGGVV